MTTASLDLKPIAGALGAEVRGIDLAEPLGNAGFARVHAALLEHLVLFFPDQDLAPEQHVAFARRFGEIDMQPFVRPLELTTLPGHPEVLEVVKEASDHALNFGGMWHHDVSFRECPNMAQALYAREVPAWGGDTMWANQYLAYESLSPGMRDMLDGLAAVHATRRDWSEEDYVAYYGIERERIDFASIERAEEAAEKTESVHPVVRTHPETGRKALFVNRSYTRRFDGMTAEESAPLLEFLYEHGGRPEFTCRRRWAAGTLALWDNRSALHYALNDYHGARRVMHRVSIHGDRPV